MLLPSALSCEFPSQQPGRFTRSSNLYASPPTSPPTSTTASTLMSTCRALHSMLSTSATSSQPSQLPTPPMSYAPAPGASRLRLRARKSDSDTTASTGLLNRRRITKRAPPRGINKRRRAVEDEGRSESEDEDEGEEDVETQQAKDLEQDGPRTPKRIRPSPIFPEVLPFGLERSDFWSLQSQNESNQSEANRAHDQHQFSSSQEPFTYPGQSFAPIPPPVPASFSGIGLSLEPAFNVSYNMQQTPGTNNSQEAEHTEDMEPWTSEEDRVLVELVLEKLKLTKSEWQDCARSLGRDRGSVGRRWRSLVGGGEVGLKRRGGMARKGIHATWR